MKSRISFLVFTCVLFLFSCTKKESAEAPNPAAAPVEAPKPVGGPHAFVHLKDGSKVPGTIVASSQTDMVVAGDDGIEREIPVTQIQSGENGEAPPVEPQSPGKGETAARPEANRQQNSQQGFEAQTP